ncbi:MAG: DNA translocase FtsK [Chloroflexi bacterium]|nr:DNA translocase FtsK [Chloroflexota bacterium]
MRRLLEYQAERIEMVLASHKVPSQVYRGTVTPRFVRFELMPVVGTKVSHVKGLGEEIALSLGIPSCRVFRQGGKINVEIPRETPHTVRLLALCRRLAEIPPCTAILGLDEEGTPLLLRLPSADVAHVLIVGRTGSGKTELARAMIASLAMYNRLGEVQLVLIDPKGQGFTPFGTLPHLLYPLVDDVEAALEVLKRLAVEMERRDHQKVTQPQVVVFIDELADLMMIGGKEMEHLLTRLLQRGRGAGIHLVACVQKPTVAIIGSLVKSNFPVRIVGSVVSPEDAKVASGLAGTGAERLLGRGDFLVVAQGQVMRLQVAYVSSQEIGELTARIKEGGRTSRRWVDEATGTDGMRPLKRLAVRLKLVK